MAKKNKNPAENTFDLVRAMMTLDKINLDLAGIFYVNAILQFDEGKKHFDKLTIEMDKYNKKRLERAKKYDVLSEKFYVFQVHKLRNIEIFYEPVVRHFTTCKILLACSAETFINEVASVKLTGRHLIEFDKLSLLGKWIFIQDIYKLKKKITIDKNPLQGFANLIVERNKLVHFKGLNKVISPYEIPDFLVTLSLTPTTTQLNIDAVKNLIQEFSLNWTGSYGPHWLNTNSSKYRNPCFYLGNRETPRTLYSDKHDKNMFS